MRPLSVPSNFPLYKYLAPSQSTSDECTFLSSDFKVSSFLFRSSSIDIQTAYNSVLRKRAMSFCYYFSRALVTFFRSLEKYIVSRPFSKSLKYSSKNADICSFMASDLGYSANFQMFYLNFSPSYVKMNLFILFLNYCIISAAVR